MLYLIVCSGNEYNGCLCAFLEEGPNFAVRTPPVYFVLYFPFCIWCLCITSLLLPRTLPYEPCCLMSHFLSFYAECTALNAQLKLPKILLPEMQKNKILLITYSLIHFFFSFMTPLLLSYLKLLCFSGVNCVHCPVLPLLLPLRNTNVYSCCLLL